MDRLTLAIGTLKSRADDKIVRGKFVLSTAEISNFWIDINEFHTPETINTMIIVMEAFILNCQKRIGRFSLVIPQYVDSSEKAFPLKYITESAIHNVKEIIHDQVLCVSISQGNQPSQFSLQGTPAGVCIIVIGVSVHISAIVGIVNCLRKANHFVEYAFAFLCRETTSLNKLNEMGIHLVPLIIASEEKGEIHSILEIEWLRESPFKAVLPHSNLVESRLS